MAMIKDGVAHFAIDAKTSLFTVQAFAAGLASVVAHSPSFAVRDLVGDMEFVPGSMKDAAVHLMFNLRSLEILDEVSRFDRREIERVMFDEVLETAKYPKVRYESTRVKITDAGESICRADVDGDLTLHGVTRGVSLDAQIVIGEDTLRAQGSFSLAQTDYGLKIASVAGGTLKLREELKCHFFILANRQA
jgi:polyisoprenoid-binding protein YceI